jgi:hypothetical protein
MSKNAYRVKVIKYININIGNQKVSLQTLSLKSLIGHKTIISRSLDILIVDNINLKILTIWLPHPVSISIY